MFRSTLRALILALLITGDARAQDARESIPVRTYTLKRLAVRDAAKLLAPYLQSAMSGAFETGEHAQAITVRGTAKELKTVDSLLAIFDRPRRSMLLHFQIIEATEETKKDPRISEVDASLRELFRYAGYRLVGEGIARVEEGFEGYETSVGIEGVSYTLGGRAWNVDDAANSVRLSLHLSQPTVVPMMNPQTLFDTQVTAEFGHVIVIGSAAPRLYNSKPGDTLTVAKMAETPRTGRPIILTLRPELDSKR